MMLHFFETETGELEFFSQSLADLEPRFHAGPLRRNTVELAANAEMLSVFIHSRLDRETLDALPRLRLIATRSTGYDHIDLETCAERGIVVSNVPAYGENTVAEHTFGLILALSRKIHHAWVRTQHADFSLTGLEGFDLKGKTLGVVGAGNIGLHVIRIARGFDMRVLAYDVHPQSILAEVLGFEYLDLDDVLERADIVTLHVPHTSATHHLMNRERFQRMKQGAVLINTARGGVVDTEALIWALDEGILSGAGLDVLEGEELIQEERQLLAMPRAEEKLRLLLQRHILARRENVVITPHIGFYSREALQRIMDETVANIRGFLGKEPRNQVHAA